MEKGICRYYLIHTVRNTRFQCCSNIVTFSIKNFYFVLLKEISLCIERVTLLILTQSAALCSFQLTLTHCFGYGHVPMTLTWCYSKYVLSVHKVREVNCTLHSKGIANSKERKSTVAITGNRDIFSLLKNKANAQVSKTAVQTRATGSNQGYWFGLLVWRQKQVNSHRLPY